MAASYMATIPALKDIQLDLKRRMEKAVTDFQTHLVSLRTGRANVQLLDQVRVTTTAPRPRLPRSPRSPLLRPA